MLPYVLVFSSSALSIHVFQKSESVSKKNKIYFSLIIAVLLPVVLGALRDVTLGTDNTRYYPMFLATARMSSPLQAILTGTKEPGYELLAFIVSRFTTDYHVLCFFTELITISFIVAGLYYYRSDISLALGLLTYFFIQYCNCINLVRQGIALAICFYAMRYAFEKRFGKFTIFVLLASSFHLASLIMFVIYFVFRFLDAKNYKIRLVAVCGVVFILTNFLYYIVRILVNIHLLSSKYLMYVSPGLHFSLKHTLFCLPILLIATVLFNYLSSKIESYKYLYALLWFEIITVQLADTFDPAYRISLFCGYAVMAVLPMFPKAFNRRSRFIANAIVILYLLAYWIYFTVFNRYGFAYPVYPYISDLF